MMKAVFGFKQKAPLKLFWQDSNGAIGLIAGFAIPVLIGMSALALEYGHGLLIRVEHQRVADLTSYSGAYAYANETGSQQQKEDAALATARSLASLNGVDPDRLELTFSEDPDGNILAQASIRSTRPLMLARMFTSNTDLEIGVRAVTRVGQSSSACIVALDMNAQGIVLTGDTFLRADDCGVASNANISLHEGCSTKVISNQAVRYGGSIDRPECVRTPAQVNVGSSGSSVPGTAADYVAEARQAALDAATALFPLPPVTGGTSITFGWWSGDPATANGAAAAGCNPNPTFSNNKWTIVCQNDVNFSSLNIPGGMDVEFILDGAEKFNVGGDINASYQGGGNSLIIGEGSTSLREINIGGDIKTAGSSCIIIGGAERNRIGGNVQLGGGAIFRSGLYAINGYLEAGQGGTKCPGSVSFTAQNATLVVKGSNGTTACGGNDAFCLKGGQANVSITPPTSGIFADFSVLGPLSSGNSRGAAFTEGAMGTQIKGLFYFPLGKFRVNGDSSSAPSANDCFQLVATEIFVKEGGSLSAGNCPSFAGSEAMIRLVQ